MDPARGGDTVITTRQGLAAALEEAERRGWVDDRIRVVPVSAEPLFREIAGNVVLSYDSGLRAAGQAALEYLAGATSRESLAQQIRKLDEDLFPGREIPAWPLSSREVVRGRWILEAVLLGLPEHGVASRGLPRTAKEMGGWLDRMAARGLP